MFEWFQDSGYNKIQRTDMYITIYSYYRSDKAMLQLVLKSQTINS